MSMDYIRRAYTLKAKRGGRVEYTGEGKPELGTITGSRGHYLRIRIDGEKRSGLYHPTWKLRYLAPTNEHKEL